MLTMEQYRYLDGVLQANLTVRPRTASYTFDDGHTPIHLQCHVTANHLETMRGWRAQLGIQWLDKGGRLLPWPHVVNRIDGELVDSSFPVDQPKLAFTLIGNDVEMFNGLVASPTDPTAPTPIGGWADPLAQWLHEDWFARLKQFSLGPGQRFDPSSPG